MQVGGETAHRRKPIGPPRRVGLSRLSRPVDRDVNGYFLRAEPVEVVGELQHQSSRLLKFEADRPAQVQVVLGGLPHRAHRAPTGH